MRQGTIPPALCSHNEISVGGKKSRDAEIGFFLIYYLLSKATAKASLVLNSLLGVVLMNRDVQQKTLSPLQYRQEDLAMLSQLDRLRDNLMAQSRESTLTKLSNYIKPNVSTSTDYSITSLVQMSLEIGLI